MRRLACIFCTALGCIPARAGEEQDRYEEQLTTRFASQRAERGARADRGEHGQWKRELEAAYPGKLKEKAGGDEAAAWFALLAGTDDEWRRTAATAAGLGRMFDRVVQRLELGPVPSIKREEFLRYARQITNNMGEAAQTNLNTHADKLFRVLDIDGDGELTGDEMSSSLRDNKLQADTSGNGRISKEEYREYFQHQVEKKAETLTAAMKANDALWRGLEGGKHAAGGLPEWFTTLDTDKDKQISLFEWRQGNRNLMAFEEMDLNGDGLLTREEYHSFIKLKEMDQKKQEK